MNRRARRIIRIALSPIWAPVALAVGLWGWWKTRKERPDDT